MSFFFQVEGGIRDVLVTGVQTCALPIFVPVRVLPAVPHDVDWHDDAGAGLTVTQGASPYEQLRRVRNLLTRACAWLRFRRDAARDLPPGRAERPRCPPLLGNAAPPSGRPDAPRRTDDGEQRSEERRVGK